MLDQAKEYAGCGLNVLFLYPNDKRPMGDHWDQTQRRSIDRLEQDAPKGEFNIGCLFSDSQYENAWGEQFHLFGVDLDIRNPELADEARAALYKVFGDQLKQVPIVVSGSGGESRHYYMWSRKAMPHLTTIAHSADKMEYNDKRVWEWSIDVVGGNHQFALPPSVHPLTGECYGWERPIEAGRIDRDYLISEELEADLHRRMVESSTGNHIGEWAHEIEGAEQAVVNDKLLELKPEALTLINEGRSRGERSEALSSAIWSMFTGGFTRGEVYRVIMDKKYGISDKPRQQKAKWSRREVDRQYQKWLRMQEKEAKQRANDETVSVGEDKEIRMNLSGFIERFHFISEGPQVADMMAPRHSALRTMSEFMAWTAPYKTKKKTRLVNTNSLWRESTSRKNLRGVGYEPGGDHVIADEFGEDYFNCYQAPPWEVLEGDEAEMEDELIQEFIDHMKYLFPKEEEREFFINWLAFNVQHPDRRCKFTPLLVSTHHGTGRGWLVELMQKLLGVNNTSVAKMSVMGGEGGESAYHNYLYRSVFCAVHEVREGSKNAFAISDKVRDILTEDHLQLNLKYGANGNQRIYTNFLLMSNHVDALKLAEEDRRIWVSVFRGEPMDEDYYIRLYDWKDKTNRGVRALFSWLTKRDILGWNGAGRAPMTEGKRAMIGASTSVVKDAFLRLLKSPPVDLMIEAEVVGAVMEIVAEEDDAAALGVGTGEIKHLLREHCEQLKGKDGAIRQVKAMRRDGKKTGLRPWILANAHRWNDIGSWQGVECRREIERLYDGADDEF